MPAVVWVTTVAPWMGALLDLSFTSKVMTSLQTAPLPPLCDWETTVTVYGEAGGPLESVPPPQAATAPAIRSRTARRMEGPREPG